MNTQVDYSHEVRQAFEARTRKLRLFSYGLERHTESSAAAENPDRPADRKVAVGDYCNPLIQDSWQIYLEFQVSLVAKQPDRKKVFRYDGGMNLGGQRVVLSTEFDCERELRIKAEEKLDALQGNYLSLLEETAQLRSDALTGSLAMRDLETKVEDLNNQIKILVQADSNSGRLIKLQDSMFNLALMLLTKSAGVMRDCMVNEPISQLAKTRCVDAFQEYVSFHERYNGSFPPQSEQG